jgi:uncharacterized protein YhdP
MSRLLALVLVFLRRSLWLGAIGLMLLALYVSLGRQLVPLVAEYRLEVQNKARELLNVPIELGNLEGRWEGFSPRLLAHEAATRCIPGVVGRLVQAVAGLAGVTKLFDSGSAWNRPN